MTHCCEHNCIDELKDDHKKILEALDELEKNVDSLTINKEGIKEFLHFTETFAEPHHQKEEQVLFPALEKKGVPKEGGPIGMMLFEHDTKRGYVKELRKALADGKEIGIKENAQNIIFLLRDHISKEENVLYPMAQEVLTEDEMAGLGGQCERIKKSI
ncbi:MAG: hemerythrin domain-containing protein [bacterium]|nr:hemerythrin domain-containing protein [bacterium]